MLLFQRCSLRKFYVREGHNARDQIAFYVFDSFLLEDQRNAGYICMPRMRYSNLEIRPAIIIIDILSKLVSLHFTLYKPSSLGISHLMVQFIVIPHHLFRTQ